MILAHKRRSPALPWLYYCPIAYLLLSLVQSDTMLLGGVSWYLVLCSLAATLFILDRLTLTWVALLGGAVAAFVGSYSAFSGLLIWPVGLLLLVYRRRSPRQVVLWIGGAIG